VSSEPVDAYRAFRHPAFRAFLVGRILGVLGLQGLSVAVGWQVYAITGNPMDLGYVGLVQFLPQLLLFPLSGVAVDRFDRKWVLVGCYGLYLCAASGMAWLSLRSDATSVLPIFAMMVVLALGRVFAGPASQAILPQLIPREDFPSAVSWASSGYTASVVIGPALGGLVYGYAEDRWHTGAVAAYGLSAALVATGLVTLMTLPTLRATHSKAPPTLRDALEGVRFIRKRPVLLSAITLDLFAVLLGGAVALLPVYAKDVLHAGPEALGLLRASPAVGALVSALWLAHRPIRRSVGWTLYATVAGFGAATLLFGLSTNVWLSVLALALTGVTDEISVFIRSNVVQLATPDHVRGRVSAAEHVFIGASNELGEMESGFAASLLGAVPAVVLGGVGTLLTVAISAWLSPELRRLDTLESLREDEAG